MNDNQIILLPKDNYGEWVTAARDYLLKFGVNTTNDPDSAGTFMFPRQIVTVVTTRDPLWAYGFDVVDWFHRNYPGVQLDVIVADTPAELEAELRGRVSARDRFAPIPGATAPTVAPAPTPPPAPAPPPAAFPAPAPSVPPPPPPSGHGLTGELSLREPRTTYARGEAIFFRETLRNPTSATVTYGVIGVKVTRAADGQVSFHTSWSGGLAIDPGCTGPTDRCGGPWDDCVRLDVAGAYRLALALCYSSKEDALSGRGEWEVLTPEVEVIVAA